MLCQACCEGGARRMDEGASQHVGYAHVKYSSLSRSTVLLVVVRRMIDLLLVRN